MYLTKIDPEYSTKINHTHDAMKRVSDFVGAFLRLGALSVIILYTYRRGMPHDEWGFMFWDLSEWSMLLFLIFLGMVWIILTFRIFSYAFFLTMSPVFSVMINYKPENPTKSRSTLSDVVVRFRKEAVIVATLICGVLLMVVLFLGGIAAVYEITVFLENV